MKLLFISEFFPTEDSGKVTGGAEARTYYLAQELLLRTHGIKVITCRLPGTTAYDNWHGLEIFRVGLNRPYTRYGQLLNRFVFIIAAVFKALTLDYELVDGNNGNVYAAAYLAARLRGKKLVYWVPDVVALITWQKAAGRIKGYLANLIEKSMVYLPADKYIALSYQTYDKLKKLGLPEGKVEVIYPGVKQTAKEAKKARGNPATIISVQRLVNYKKTDTVIRALAILVERGYDLRYRIIGEGERRKVMEDLAEKLGVSQRVKFLGNLPHPEVLKEISRADIFSLPSAVEGFGIVSLEAMSQGIPFVNSDINVNREIETASHGGLIFKLGDPEDLAEKLEKLLKDNDLYQKLSQSGLKFARNHTWGKVARETERVYKSLFSR